MLAAGAAAAPAVAAAGEVLRDRNHRRRGSPVQARGYEVDDHHAHVANDLSKRQCWYILFFIAENGKTGKIQRSKEENE